MTQKQTYDFEAKKEYRNILRKFILKHFPKGSKRERLRVACLPGHEGLEVTEVYLPLGVRPDRIWGIENNPEIAQQIRDLRLGINVYSGGAGDFFSQPGEPFDVVNLDFQGQFKIAEQETLKSIIDYRRVSQKFIIGTNFFASRERPNYQDSLRSVMSNSALKEIANSAREHEILDRTIWQRYANKGVLGIQGDEDLGLIRDKFISLAVYNSLILPTSREIVNFLGENLKYHLREKEDLEDIKAHPEKHRQKIIALAYLAKMDTRVFLERQLGDHIEVIFPSSKKEDMLDVITRYAMWSKANTPYFLRDFHKGRYVSDKGSPMLFDILCFSSQKNFFTNPVIKIENLKNRKLYFELDPKRLNQFAKDLWSFERLRESASEYIQSERLEIQIKPEGEKIREDLARGMPEDKVAQKYGLKPMQLAGHKAALSRAKGNGNGKKNGNGNLYKPTSEEEAEIVEFLQDESVTDEEIIAAYPITKMQLAARKAGITRRTRELNGQASELEIRTGILQRDDYRCQYNGCQVTEEQNIATSGHGLHVHHIDYNHDNNDPENQISLCTSHHAMTNTVQHGPEMRRQLEERINEIYDNNQENKGTDASAEENVA